MKTLNKLKTKLYLLNPLEIAIELITKSATYTLRFIKALPVLIVTVLFSIAKNFVNAVFAFVVMVAKALWHRVTRPMTRAEINHYAHHDTPMGALSVTGDK